MNFDVFISHASEDKADVATPLTAKPRSLGLNVWLDSKELKLGDSLRRNIDEGLRQSKYGVVVLSPNFFRKEWPQKELDALVAREDGRSKVILPILHNITHEGVAGHSLLLSDRLAANTSKGIDIVALQIADVIRGDDKSVEWNSNERTVIGISGASCAGKTWLAEKFQSLSPNNIAIFDLDGYYRELHYVDRLDCKHDNPNAIDFESAIRDLAILKTGREVNIPVYNYETHERIGSRLCRPTPLLVVEGLFIYANKIFRDEIDIKVWVNAGDVLRHQRRVRRDTQERGRDVLEVLNRYDDYVVPGFERFIKPLQQHADLVLENNGRDPNQQPLAVELLMSYIHRVKPSAIAS